MPELIDFVRASVWRDPHVGEDHKPDEAQKPDRAQLVAEAESLGLKVDGRWSDDKLGKAIGAAREAGNAG